MEEEAAPPPPEPETAAVPEPEPAPEAPPLPEAPGLDRERVYEIVHKVVAKMSPPAFPAEAIENMARKFADEISDEIGL